MADTNDYFIADAGPYGQGHSNGSVVVREDGALEVVPEDDFEGFYFSAETAVAIAHRIIARADAALAAAAAGS